VIAFLQYQINIISIPCRGASKINYLLTLVIRHWVGLRDSFTFDANFGIQAASLAASKFPKTVAIALFQFNSVASKLNLIKVQLP